MYRNTKIKTEINEESRKRLSDNLVRFRKENNMSRECLALVCGIDVKHLSRIERGTANASLDTLDKISEGTGIPVWLLIAD